MTLQPLPSAKRLHNYGKSPCLMGKPWKTHYFDWAIFYVAFCMFTISGNGKTQSEAIELHECHQVFPGAMNQEKHKAYSLEMA